MNPRVLTVEYKGGYKLLVTFTNKEVKQFDLTDYLNYPIYEPLKDETFCKKVKAVNGVVQWDEFIDISPDTIYLNSEPIN